jgi:5'-3' exonuclease
MGIPGFFNAISKNYQIGVSSSKIIKSPIVYIDFNSLVYTAKYSVANILGKHIKSKLGFEAFDPVQELEDKIDLSNPSTISGLRDSMIFDTIKVLVSNILAQTSNPTVHIYLDGVPFIGKMIEQRKRALLGSLIEKGKQLIASNTYIDPLDKEFTKFEPYINLDKMQIKPGTEFMDKLDRWLTSTYSNPQYTISGFGEPGEAEHKIMQEIISNHGSQDLIVYSPDADMIVLLLPLCLTNKIYLVRDSVDKSVYDLNILIEDIAKFFSCKDETIKKRIIYDICFVYNIFGNDFLPKFDFINIYDKKTIGKVLSVYEKYLLKYPNSYLITEMYEISWLSYAAWLELLDKEFSNIKRDRVIEPDSKLDPAKFTDQIYSLNNFGKGFYAKSYDNYVWTKTFYTNSVYFEIDHSIDSIICDYCVGMLMVELLYTRIYTSKLSAEELMLVELFHYPHHKAPLIPDIYKWIKQALKQKTFKSTIQSHISKRLALYPKLFKPDYKYQLYYITPLYEDFLDLTNESSSNKLYPKLPQHELYEQYISQLVWDKSTNKLNIVSLIDCNAQRFIDKCIPLLATRLENQWVNLVFDPIDWIK